MKWFIKGIKQFWDFNGRARRKEYWMFTLFYWIFSFVVSFIDVVIFDETPALFSILFSLFLFFPVLAITFRRLQDTGRNGIWVFIVFIPIIGWIWLFILLCLDSQAGNNDWGENPKEQI